MKKNIRVYNGHGGSQTGAKFLCNEFDRYIDAPVSPIDDHEMNGKTGWLTNTALLVFAGKSVTQFKAALTTKTRDNIVTSVKEGSFNYLGICAGSAFAAAHIKYDVIRDGSKTRLINTGLSLFNGQAIGPISRISKHPFLGTTADLKLVDVYNTANQKNEPVVYWGGPALYPLEKGTAIKPIAYLKGTSLPLALSTRYGKGLAVLCGYHPEINQNNIGYWIDECTDLNEISRLAIIRESVRPARLPNLLFNAGLIEFYDPTRKVPLTQFDDTDAIPNAGFNQ